jgi:hypothetical protein
MYFSPQIASNAKKTGQKTDHMGYLMAIVVLLRLYSANKFYFYTGGSLGKTLLVLMVDVWVYLDRQFDTHLCLHRLHAQKSA